MLDATMEAGRVDIDDEADPGVRVPARVPPKRFSAIAANVSYVPWMMPWVPM